MFEKTETPENPQEKSPEALIEQMKEAIERSPAVQVYMKVMNAIDQRGESEIFFEFMVEPDVKGSRAQREFQEEVGNHPDVRLFQAILALRADTRFGRGRKNK